MSLRSFFGARSGAGGAVGGDERDPPDARERVRVYHQLTKHDFHAYARGPGYLEWDTQPDPFRRYAGAAELALEVTEPAHEPAWEDVLAGAPLARSTPDRAALSRLFQDSLGLTAWKQAGTSRWALRANPSSGNLHPTEGYVVGGPFAGLADEPVVAHYAPREHLLEVRAVLPAKLWSPLAAALGEGGFLLGLTSIHWREAWKYGERAYRYCQHDCGHALAALAITAAALGWKVRMLDELATDDVARVLGVGDGDGDPDGPEPEHPDVLLAVTPGAVPDAPVAPELLAGFDALDWRGTPNVLSEGHEDWEVIEVAAEAARKPVVAPPWPPWRSALGPFVPDARRTPLGPLVRGRRSAVAMDGKTSMPAADFFRALSATLPRPGAVPFAAFPGPPRIHLALFVNRVDGLERGIYLLVRDPARRVELRASMRAEFLWERPEGTPDELDLVALWRGDARGMATRVSCGQDIAGMGCFSLGMLADFERPIAELGAWTYPRLFWEAGALGQVLYLESEALDLRATGIGCYFDDPMHAALGLTGRAYQSLYHFTVGGAVWDERITSLPAYPAPTA